MNRKKIKILVDDITNIESKNALPYSALIKALPKVVELNADKLKENLKWP